MATVFTGSTSAAGSGQMSNQVITAYERAARFALRDEAVWDQFAKVKPGNLTNPGTPVSFEFWNDMTEATTPLSEVTDVDPVGLSDTQVTITPAEYGNAVLKTIRLMTDTFLVGWDADVANLVNENMVKSIDTLARVAVDAATNITTIDGGATASLTAGDVLTAAAIRQRHAQLRRANARPWFGELFAAVISPEVAYDVKVETGDAGWLVPAAYVDTQRIYTNEIGTWGGFKFLESNRTLLTVDGGSSADVHNSYFFGQEFLAKAEAIAPRIVQGPITDTLMRFRPIGWHAYLAYKVLRQATVRVITSSATIQN